MSAPLLFMPARASTEELEQTFVGRWDVLKEIEKNLLADVRRHTARHFQIIAPRGSGKSHLTQLLARLLQRDHGWDVVVLPEEHYQIASVAEFLEQIVIRLENLAGTPFKTEREVDVEDLALDRLRKWRATTKRPLLVVLENLGALLERKLTSRREQQRMRQILSTDPPFILLTTATGQVDALVHHDAPFYDFFQPKTLDDLSRDDVAALIDARAKWDRDDALLANPEVVRARLDAIYHFSGGNPRLVLDLYSVLRRGVTQDMHAQLLRLLDEVTPYYQARLNDIAPQMARILTEMALADRNLTPSEVAVRCRMATNHVTANLARLEQERLVLPVGRPDRRRRYYEVSDRLLRLWMQVRESPAARARLRPLVEFFRRWYEENKHEMDEGASNVALAFWKELGSDTTPASCRDKLETLAYLEEAAGLADEGSLSLSALHEASAQATKDPEERIRHLSELFERSTNNEHKATVGYLLSNELAASGKAERALEVIRSVVDKVEGGANTFIWREYLEVLRRVKGSERSFTEGLRAVDSHPALWPLKRDLAIDGARRGDSKRTLDFLEDFLARAQCAHCKKEMVFRVAWQAATTGHPDIAERVLQTPGIEKLVSVAARSSLRVLLDSEGKHSVVERIQRALREWKTLEQVPTWIVWEASCLLSHDAKHAADAFQYVAEFIRRERPMTQAAVTHTLLAMLAAIAAGDEAQTTTMLDWIARHVDAPLLRAAFLEDMTSYSRRRGVHVLRAYELLRARKMIDEDLSPFSAAVRVASASDKVAELAALHPELREAVEMLLDERRPVGAANRTQGPRSHAAGRSN